MHALLSQYTLRHLMFVFSSHLILIPAPLYAQEVAHISGLMCATNKNLLVMVDQFTIYHAAHNKVRLEALINFIRNSYRSIYIMLWYF